MSSGASKILPIVLYVLLGISTLLGVLFYSDVIGSDTLIYWCYALLIIGIATTLISSLVRMIGNPRAGKSALIGLVALVVVFAVSYVLAGDEMTPKYADFISGPEASKLVGSGIIAFYILGLGAIAAVVISSLSKLVK